MTINFLTQRKLEDFIRSHAKRTSFSVVIFTAEYGTSIKVSGGQKQHHVPIPNGDRASDTLADVNCIIKENGFLISS